ncbi:MAG: hypothetical protein PCFJNLEI_02861 [Verrucomicrobiae bacterium]|nr:hypothetical protein [Verrucomicrobiae bacterium]
MNASATTRSSLPSNTELASIVAAHLARQARHEKHPVIDFLFEYYTHRPAQLLRYSPGKSPLPAERRRAAEWIANLLEATLHRPPQFACHGLHEWAMVYRGEARRHDLPLRLSQAEIDALVESLPVNCTHFDAYRFFTPSALPLNRVPVTRESQQAFEQPGCLHANMDLYKWAYKFQPWLPSDLMVDAFLLAVEIREVDMRATPYDLTRYGYAPIPIETPAGRQEYQRFQQELFSKAQALRTRLLNAYRRLLASGPRA